MFIKIAFIPVVETRDSEGCFAHNLLSALAPFASAMQTFALVYFFRNASSFCSQATMSSKQGQDAVGGWMLNKKGKNIS